MHISAQENTQKGVYMCIYCGLEDQLSVFRLMKLYINETRSSNSA